MPELTPSEPRHQSLDSNMQPPRNGAGQASGYSTEARVRGALPGMERDLVVRARSYNQYEIAETGRAASELYRRMRERHEQHQPAILENDRRLEHAQALADVLPDRLERVLKQMEVLSQEYRAMKALENSPYQDAEREAEVARRKSAVQTDFEQLMKAAEPLLTEGNKFARNCERALSIAEQMKKTGHLVKGTKALAESLNQYMHSQDRDQLFALPELVKAGTSLFEQLRTVLAQSSVTATVQTGGALYLVGGARERVIDNANRIKVRYEPAPDPELAELFGDVIRLELILGADGKEIDFRS